MNKAIADGTYVKPEEKAAKPSKKNVKETDLEKEEDLRKYAPEFKPKVTIKLSCNLFCMIFCVVEQMC